jgi:CRISPR-associated Cas5-like protein
MKALTFTLTFRSAQFKLHHQKIARSTYVVPPPSVVAGIIGAILGVKTKELARFCSENNIRTGAILLKLAGQYVTLSRIFKFDRPLSSLVRLLQDYWNLLVKYPKSKEEEKIFQKRIRELLEIMPIINSEELFNPTYKLAVAGMGSIMDELRRRLESLDFEYEIFGGNDYHFLEDVGKICAAKLVLDRLGEGYLSPDLFGGLKRWKEGVNIVIGNQKRIQKKLPMVIRTQVGPSLETFLVTVATNMIAKKRVEIVDDGYDRIFVHDPRRFLASW